MKELANAIFDVFQSPNVNDSNMDSANVVDTLDSLGYRTYKGLEKVANAINNLADAIRETK